LTLGYFVWGSYRLYSTSLLPWKKWIETAAEETTRGYHFYNPYNKIGLIHLNFATGFCLNGANDDIKEAYLELKSAILTLGNDVEIRSKKYYFLLSTNKDL
jgi:hypothetical protein